MTNAEAQCNNSLRPRKPEGSLGRTAQDGHLGSHTAPELCTKPCRGLAIMRGAVTGICISVIRDRVLLPGLKT